MANKKNVQSMTPEELAAYVETVRQRNAATLKSTITKRSRQIQKNIINFW